MANKVWTLNDPDLPKELFYIRDIFLPEIKDKRKEKESLHDYFMRKGLKCFCGDCRVQTKLT